MFHRVEGADLERWLTVTAALLGSLAVLAGTVAVAAATEVTRDSYREAVEPICKANTEDNERILAGVRTEVRQGKLNAAATRFSEAAKALKQTITQLRAVPRPRADASRLSKWLSEVGTEAALFERVATKLRAGDKVGAQQMVVKLVQHANATNALVLPFEFHYCWLEPSRFT